MLFLPAPAKRRVVKARINGREYRVVVQEINAGDRIDTEIYVYRGYSNVAEAGFSIVSMPLFLPEKRVIRKISAQRYRVIKVEEEHRGKGIGRYLSELMTEEARSKECDASFSDALNPISQHLLASQGFIPFSVHHSVVYMIFPFKKKNIREILTDNTFYVRNSAEEDFIAEVLEDIAGRSNYRIVVDPKRSLNYRGKHAVPVGISFVFMRVDYATRKEVEKIIKKEENYSREITPYIERLKELMDKLYL